jgi:hypothetical protein
VQTAQSDDSSRLVFDAVRRVEALRKRFEGVTTTMARAQSRVEALQTAVTDQELSHK